MQSSKPFRCHFPIASKVRQQVSLEEKSDEERWRLYRPGLPHLHPHAVLLNSELHRESHPLTPMFCAALPQVPENGPYAADDYARKSCEGRE